MEENNNNMNEQMEEDYFEESVSPVPTESDQDEQTTETSTEKIPEENEMIDDAQKEGVNENFLEDVFKILLKKELEENEEEVEEVEEVTSGNVEEVNEVENESQQQEVSGGSANDYSSLLSTITDQLAETNVDIETIISQNENNNMNSTLNSQSCTNVLLIVIIVILLVDILIHFIRGLF